VEHPNCDDTTEEEQQLEFVERALEPANLSEAAKREVMRK